MILKNKQSFILLGCAALLVLVVIVLVVSSFFLPTSQNNDLPSIPTPTPVPYSRQPDGTFSFTPLERTTINKTTSKEVEERETILNKSLRGTATVYEVPSATPEETDEIRTQNGIVIFESINLFNETAGVPPKVNVYKKEFGEAEIVHDSVSPLGKHISAHIYAEDGFTLFVNRFTSTVYEIHRFPPMSTAEYEEQYAEYLQPAPEYPQEFHDQ